MGKHVSPREMIVQKSVGFRFRQREFFNKYQEFKPDEFCRNAIDEQIKLIDPEFLKKEEKDLDEL